MSNIRGPFVDQTSFNDGIRREDEQLKVRFIIEDVAGEDMQMLRNAIRDSRIPIPGSRADYYPELVLRTRQFNVIGSAKVEAILNYGRPDVAVQEVTTSEFVPTTPNETEAPPPSEENIPNIAVGSTTGSVETSFDAQGQPLRVRYKDEEVTKTATRETPVPTLNFSRLEPFHPLFKSVAYVGRVNSAPFAGFGPNYWICRAINGQLQRLANGTFAYAVTYEFQGAPEGEWKVRLFYVDPESGEVPEDISLGNGIAEYNLYPAVDFNALNLPVPGAPVPEVPDGN